MPTGDTHAALAQVLREVTRNDGLAIEPEMALAEIPGWDSVRLVETILSVEDRFAIEFKPGGFNAARTVADLVQLIDDARN